MVLRLESSPSSSAKRWAVSPRSRVIGPQGHSRVGQACVGKKPGGMAGFAQAAGKALQVGFGAAGLGMAAAHQANC